jgi:putative endonuclease
MARKDELGRAGEDAAADYLLAHGLRILDRNWRCGEGELDIVAAQGQALVVVEVKTRSGTGFGRPTEAVTWAKQRRLRRLAAAWLSAHGIRFASVRIDVIGLVPGKPGEFTIEHVQGVG